MQGQNNQSDGSELDTAPQLRRGRRLSAIFTKLARDAKGSISIGDIRDKLGKRSFAPLLVLFAAFNMLPVPPGASAVLGLPLLIVAAQMTFGSNSAWLPCFITNRSLSAEQFRTVTNWVIPKIIRLEEVVRPRYWPFWRKRGDRVIGIIALILSVSITLPIPFGNWLPAFATALLGLALSERDGILFAVGSIIGVASLTVVCLVVGGAGFATHALMVWLG